MAVRDRCPQTLATGRATIAASHIRGCPGLVDKDETARIEIGLALKPLPTPCQDIGSVLLRRMGRLFLRVIRWRRKKRCRVV
jgi:hypothetical protein